MMDECQEGEFCGEIGLSKFANVVLKQLRKNKSQSLCSRGRLGNLERAASFIVRLMQFPNQSLLLVAQSAMLVFKFALHMHSLEPTKVKESWQGFLLLTLIPSHV
jgi:hypothetical protein